MAIKRASIPGPGGAVQQQQQQQQHSKTRKQPPAAKKNSIWPKDTPGARDIICGRGCGRHSKAKGNLAFREMVLSMRDQYDKAERTKKANISKRVVDQFRKDKNRFMSFDPVTKCWTEMSYKKSIEKTSQTFRDIRSKEEKSPSTTSFLSSSTTTTTTTITYTSPNDKPIQMPLGGLKPKTAQVKPVTKSSSKPKTTTLQVKPGPKKRRTNVKVAPKSKPRTPQVEETIIPKSRPESGCRPVTPAASVDFNASSLLKRTTPQNKDDYYCTSGMIPVSTCSTIQAKNRNRHSEWVPCLDVPKPNTYHEPAPFEVLPKPSNNDRVFPSMIESSMEYNTAAPAAFPIFDDIGALSRDMPLVPPPPELVAYHSLMSFRDGQSSEWNFGTMHDEDSSLNYDAECDERFWTSFGPRVSRIERDLMR
jgi:hypothetical protein